MLNYTHTQESFMDGHGIEWEGIKHVYIFKDKNDNPWGSVVFELIPSTMFVHPRLFKTTPANFKKLKTAIRVIGLPIMHEYNYKSIIIAIDAVANQNIVHMLSSGKAKFLGTSKMQHKVYELVLEDIL